MKPKTMILMVVAVACGLGASYMTSKLLAERNNRDQNEASVPVLVATSRILAWQPIKEPEKYFEVKQFPESVAPPKALKDFLEIKDKRLNKPLDVGKPVTEADLLTKEQMSLAENLLPGQRAIAIKVTAESLVAGFVLPGTRVDIVCTQKGTESLARIILQNMMVLAVDTQDQRSPEVKTIVGQTVTLAATPEESVRLSLAQSVGELRLLLKSGADTKRINTVVAHTGDLAKALATDSEREGESTRTALAPTVPTLPPVADDPKKTTAAPEEKKAEKKRKRHVMTIRHGSSTEKVVFPLGNYDDEDDSTPKTKSDKEDKPKGSPKRPSRPRRVRRRPRRSASRCAPGASGEAMHGCRERG
jgi:pilus assembly protein CpaB